MSLAVGSDSWRTLANPIYAANDVIKEIWVCENNALSKIYPVGGLPSSDVYWYWLLAGTGVQRDFHLCVGLDHVPAWAKQDSARYGKLLTYTQANQRAYHNLASYFVSVTIDEPLTLLSGADIFHSFTACRTMNNLNYIYIDPTCASTNRMFYACGYLTALDISSWDMSHVLDIDGMFAGEATSTLQSNSRLTSLLLPDNFGASATTAWLTFSGLKVLTQLDTTKVKTGNLTNMEQIFQGCWRLTELDLSGWDTSNVTNMDFAFSNMTDIQTIYASALFDTSAVTSGTQTFGGNSGCPNLRGGAGTTWNSANTDYTYARIDTAGAPGYFTQR